MSAPVKWFLSSHTGAPTLTGAPGAMQAILHACLVTGFNISSVADMVRSGSTVTVTVSTGHGLAVGQVVRISGALEAEYNDDFIITAADTTSFSFELPAGVEPATPATGTIECRQAPAGWERPFVSGDSLRAAFRSTAVDATGFYIYVDDTNNQGTRRTGVKGYESMTDIDTGSNPFPYSSDDSKWGYIYKGSDETTARDWALVADDRLFYFYHNNGSDRIAVFGDMISLLPTDDYCCVLGAGYNAGDDAYFAPVSAICEYNKTDDRGFYVARDWSGLENDGRLVTPFVPQLIFSSGGDVEDYYPRALGEGHALPWPPISSGGIITSPIQYIERNPAGNYVCLRAQAPGLLAQHHSNPFNELAVVTLADCRYLVIPNRAGRDSDAYNPRATGQVLADINGPWRG